VTTICRILFMEYRRYYHPGYLGTQDANQITLNSKHLSHVLESSAP